MKVCVSYARDGFDSTIADGIVQALQKSLSPQDSVWYDRRIQPGTGWDAEIDWQFTGADLFIVLASEAYFKSDYIQRRELPLILKQIHGDEKLLFWIPLDRSPEGFRVFPLGAQLADREAVSFHSDYSGADLELFYARLARDVQQALLRRKACPEDGRPPAAEVPPERELYRAYLLEIEYQVRDVTRAKAPGGERWFPFERLYVMLTADYRPLGEREAGKQLLHGEVDAIHAPRMEATARVLAGEDDRRVADLVELGAVMPDSLERIFRIDRAMVIRGAPGSGKTVLCSYLALHLARAMQRSLRFENPLTAPRAVFLGPPRVPILISIRAFADWKRDHPRRDLFDYLGHHRRGKALEDIEPDAVNGFLRTRLERGEAVVLLDGLDEVPSGDRARIVRDIEHFAEASLRRYQSADAPERAGGNQILITSRIAGYDIEPVTHDMFRQYVIRPFDDEAKEQFCRNWAEVRFPGNMRAAVELRRYVLQDALPAIQQLATNPLLLSTMCELAAPLLARDKGNEPRPLPRSRAALYQQAVESMGQRWRKAAADNAASQELSELLENRILFAMLAKIAREMHEFRDDSGRPTRLTRITAEQFRQQVWPFVFQRVFGKPQFALEAERAVALEQELTDLLRTHVGVFAERAPDVFEFLHLTFQEYLAGYDLCLTAEGDWQSADGLALEIVSRAVDPAWREPLLLAFGQLGQFVEMHDAGAPRPEAVFHMLEKRFAAGESGLLADDATIFLAELWLELPDNQLNDAPARELATTLVQRYMRLGSAERSAAPRRRLSSAMAALRRRFFIAGDSSRETMVDTWLAHLIESDPELVAPVGHLVREHAWYTPSVMTAFVNELRNDDAQWGWPLHGSLRETALEHPLRPPLVAKLDRPAGQDAEAHRQRMLSEVAVAEWRARRIREAERLKPQLPHPPRMRAFLLERRAASERLKTENGVRRVLAVLCGGFQDLQSARLLREYRDLVMLLSKADQSRTYAIEASPERYFPQFGIEDVIYQIAVYLDTNQGSLGAYRTTPPELRPEWIVRDTAGSVAEIVEGWLTGDHPETELHRRLRDAVDAQGAGSAEAALALLVAGENATFRFGARQNDKLKWLLERTLDELRDPVLRSATVTTSSIWNLLDEWLPQLPDAAAAAVFRLVTNTLIDAGGLPLLPTLECNCGPLLGRAYRVERWAALFCGSGEDPVYEFAVGLDTLSVGENAAEVAATLSGISESANARLMPFRRAARVPWGLGENGGHPTPLFFQMLDELFQAAEAIGADLGVGFVEKCIRASFSADATILVDALVRNFVRAGDEQSDWLNERRSGRSWWHSEAGADGDSAAIRHLRIRDVDLPPVDRALLLAHAAEATTGQSADELFGGALQAAAEVPDVEWRAEFLRRTRIIASRSEATRHAHSAEADRLPSSLAAAEAKGELAAFLCTEGRLPRQPVDDAWVAITAFATCRAKLEMTVDALDEDDFWSDIETSQSSTAVVGRMDGLVDRAGQYGLRLTSAAATAIESLMERPCGSEASSALRRLLPLIRQFDSAESQRLRRWAAADRDDTIRADVGCLAALLLAERTRSLQPAWVDALVELAGRDDDLASARANLVLGGARLAIDRTERDYHLAIEGDTVFLRLLKSEAERRTLPKGQQWKCDAAWYLDGTEELRRCFEAFEQGGPDGQRMLTVLLFGGQRWSQECLTVVRDWLESHPDQWNELWLSWYCTIVRLQGADIPERLDGIVRDLAIRLTPAVHYISPEHSYADVVQSCRAAIQEGSSDLVASAQAAFAASFRSLDVSVADWPAACRDVGESLLQGLEDQLEDVQIPEAEGAEALDVLLDWLEVALEEWASLRLDMFSFAQETSATVVNALLTVASLVTASWPDRYAARALRSDPPTRLSELLMDAALYHRRHLSRQAALVLLSRTPGLPVGAVARVFDSAVQDRATVRTRAMLLMPRFRELQTDAFVEEVLNSFDHEQRAGAKLAKAELLARLVTRNAVRDSETRKRIIRAFEDAGRDPANRRPLAVLAGTGDEKDPRTVEILGRLDIELQTLLPRMSALPRWG